MTQQGPASINAIGVRISFGSSWLDTNSSVWLNVLTLTQNGTGFEISDADTNEFIFTRVGIEGPGTGIDVDLLGGKWRAPSSARANHFGTVSAVPCLVARAGAQPSTRNVVTNYNNESGEKPPVIEHGADINITDDEGNPIGNTGFTVNHIRDVYTPTVSRETGSPTAVTANADFRRFGREILGIRLDVKVTGDSGNIKVSLPCPPFKDTQITGFDRATGKSLQGRIGFADPSVYIYSADGTAPGSSSQPLVTGDLECSN
ncbi:hypothetical protein R1A27_06375 [Methylobacterium sp. NMS12]|uniref:hypothetical protein n=1 Tax=Methylobacterium sp. NMS12 TaxID=3079766 RepID=UPI003F8842D3